MYMKKDLDYKTKLNPVKRVEALYKLIEGISNNEQSKIYLEKCGIEFSSNILKMNAKQLKTEKIAFRDKVSFYFNY